MLTIENARQQLKKSKERSVKWAARPWSSSARLHITYFSEATPKVSETNTEGGRQARSHPESAVQITR